MPASPMSIVTAMPLFFMSSGLRNCSRLSGQPADPLGGLGLRGHEVGQLDEKEGEVALLPVVVPVGDQGLQLKAVEGRAGVRFALVPDRAAKRIGDQRGDHAVVQRRGGPGRSRRVLRRLRFLLLEFFPPALAAAPPAPSGQLLLVLRLRFAAGVERLSAGSSSTIGFNSGTASCDLMLVQV